MIKWISYQRFLVEYGSYYFNSSTDSLEEEIEEVEVESTTVESITTERPSENLDDTEVPQEGNR